MTKLRRITIGAAALAIVSSAPAAVFLRERDILVATSAVRVRYDPGDGAPRDGRAHDCWGRANLVYLELPGATHEWWAVDRFEPKIYQAHPPRTFLGTRTYPEDQAYGVTVDFDLKIGRYTWEFGDRRCRFAQAGFWCEVEWDAEN